MRYPLFVVGAVVVSLMENVAIAQPVTSAAMFDPFVSRLQQLVLESDIEGYIGLLTSTAAQDEAREFAEDTFRKGIDASAVQVRFLLPLDNMPEGSGYELTVEVFTEQGAQGRLQTWRMDVTRTVDQNGNLDWRVAAQQLIDDFDELIHLSLDPNVHFDAANLVVASEDMTLQMSEGTAFVVRTAKGGVTGLVLIGNGLMTFSPEPEAERGQVRILTGGNNTLETEFSEVFVRVNPVMFAYRVSTATLIERQNTSSDFDRAQELFNDFAPLSYAVDLSDLSDNTWSLIPSAGSFIAEIRTDRYGTLTYSQVQNNVEDITLFERETQRIISLYSSTQKRAAHGRYYNDDIAYDILNYEIDASFTPSGATQESFLSRPRLRGCFIDGTARLAIRVTGQNLSTLTLRLADELDVHSVVSSEFGPMLFLRMRDQNNLIISLPQDATTGTEFTIELSYSGLLEAPTLEENWIGLQRHLYAGVSRQPYGESPFGIGTPRYVYSNSSYWYPQATTSDYATATMDLSVPHDYGIIASGEPAENNPPLWTESNTRNTVQRRYRFVTTQPARYLSCVISQFVADATTARDITFEHQTDTPQPQRSGVSYNNLSLNVRANARNQEHVGMHYQDTADILKFYGSLIGDVPYPTFTLVLTDAILPGGHAPAYFAVLNQPLPMASGRMLSWRNDPVAFSSFPTFFVAHELAHQWWGQAVGWKNYHEQWLSESLAQYFAALYAEHRNGKEIFTEVLSQMTQWSLRYSDRGPVYLGNRLGRLDGDPRIFRALVYNKGAMVLHMLRRTIGDEIFFNSLRRFYNEHRFTKAGTNDLILAFETESGRSLTDFFEQWIHETTLPKITFTYRTEASIANEQDKVDTILRFEQQKPPFELPVTVNLHYRNGESDSVVVLISEPLTEVRIPLRWQLQDVEVNGDGAALVEIE